MQKLGRFHIMSGNMDIAHALCIHIFLKKLKRQQSVVDGVDVNIVHVQMNTAVSFTGNRVEELDLVHLGKRGNAGSRTCFLRQYGSPTGLALRIRRAVCCTISSVKGSGSRYAEMTAVVAVAQMVGEKRAIVTAHHFFDSVYQIGIQRCLSAQRHG